MNLFGLQCYDELSFYLSFKFVCHYSCDCCYNYLANISNNVQYNAQIWHLELIWNQFQWNFLSPWEELVCRDGKKKKFKLKNALKDKVILKDNFFVKENWILFTHNSCMHLELMHSCFSKDRVTALSALLLVLPWAMGGAEQQKCLQICWAFEKLLHKSTLNFLVKQSLYQNCVRLG